VASLRSWVDLPEPSRPSKVRKNPRGIRAGYREQGTGCRVRGCRVWSLGFRVEGAAAR
jgi:hypothetical protein